MLLSLVHVFISFTSGQTIPDVLSSNPRIVLAADYTRKGQAALAEKQYLAAVRETAKGDPLLHGHVLNMAATFFHEVGNFPRSESFLRKSLEIWRARHGPEHISLAPMINRLACVYIEAGEPAKAERLHLEEWIARLAEQKPSSDDHVNLLGTYATLLSQRRRYQAAERYSRDALDRLAARGEAESMDSVAMVNNLGLVSLEAGDLQKARQYLERADELLRKSRIPHPFYHAVNRTLLARVLQKEKRYGEAETLLKQGIALMELRCGPDSLRTAMLLVEYSGLLREQKKKAEARQVEQRAQAIVQASGLAAFASTVDASDLRGRR